MTKKNEQNNTQLGGGGGSHTTPASSTTTITNTNTTSGIMIVQQQLVSEQQQHFVLPAVNNSAPMIITTPLGRKNLIEIFLEKFQDSFFQFSGSFYDYPTITNNNECPATNGSSCNQQFCCTFIWCKCCCSYSSSE
jgi:hypothetical protein